MIIPNEVQERINTLMLEHNISKEELCEKINIKLSTFDSWKKRNTIPTTEILLKISIYFQFPIDYLLTGNYYNITNFNLIYKQGFHDGIEFVKNKINKIK